MVQVELQIDQRVKLSKGYAQIVYENAADAEKAQLHMDGGQLDGNVLRVSFVLVDQQRRRRAESREEGITSSPALLPIANAACCT
jgi:RNA-binding protein with serine-rich domain 1